MAAKLLMKFRSTAKAKSRACRRRANAAATRPALGLLVLWLAMGCVDGAEVRAFPGAEGFGAYAKGGRGGAVVRVTNLGKRGEGSFAWALNEVEGPRTIVFEVSGVIDCEDEIGFFIRPGNDHVTIAGETSPGGIAVYNYRRFEIKEGAEEVIMRFMRFRGTRIHTKNDPDCLLVWNAENVIVDHCSFAGACDETISTSDAQNVTIQWTGYDESRKAEAHNDYFINGGQWHNYGGLYSNSKGITIHHCLFAHHSKRNPLVSGDSYVEAVNNVIYNYSNEQQTWGAAGEGLAIGHCYFKLGPDRRKRPVPVRDDVLAIRGCVSRERDGAEGPAVEDLGKEVKWNLELADSAEEAYEKVLKLAGALPHDATSARMAAETRTGTGSQGYAADMEADRAALAGDAESLPEEWPDASTVRESGYTALEEWCHARAAALIAGGR